VLVHQLETLTSNASGGEVFHQMFFIELEHISLDLHINA
jgi:hypothetical protein